MIERYGIVHVLGEEWRVFNLKEDNEQFVKESKGDSIPTYTFLKLKGQVYAEETGNLFVGGEFSCNMIL